MARNDRARCCALMPWVFVLIWSTGFVVARLGMPHSPPLTLPAHALRAVDAVLRRSGSLLARARLAAAGARQWLHLAVSGVLMHAGYLGGVWAAVKAGIGAGTVALLVGLQPVLTALWLSATAAPAETCRTDAACASGSVLLLGLAGLALVVWPKLGMRRGDAVQPGAGPDCAAQHHRRHAVPEALRRAVRRAHRERDAAGGRPAGQRCRWRCSKPRPMRWHPAARSARWPGRCWC